MTSPARTWCDLAAVLDLGDLVAVGDYLVSRRLPLVTIAEFAGRLAPMGSGRGIRMARRAVDLVRMHRPRPESRLRVVLAVAGLPEPTINHTLVDTETGKHLRPDFLFAEAKVILEYQGDYHRSRSQWRRDDDAPLTARGAGLVRDGDQRRRSRRSGGTGVLHPLGARSADAVTCSEFA